MARPNTIAEAVGDAILAEQQGFDLLGVSDSQSVYRELYVTLSACAGATSRLLLAPAVTNPVTRHPAVAASAIASVADLAGGRTIFGIGSGNNAVLNLSERPAGLAGLRDYITAVRDLLATGKAVYRGRELAMSWSGFNVPIYMSAEGPKTLELAGEIADGVIVNPGLQPELIHDVLRSIRTGAERVGRDIAEIDIWMIVRVNVCDDAAAGVAAITMELASNAHHVFRFTTDGKRLPDGLVDAVRRVQAGYVPAQHEHIGGANAVLLRREPELLGYLAERFAVVGPPEACAAKLRAAAGAGIGNFLFTGFVADRPALMRALGERVVPLVAGT
jgi:5,10-methylenetetrahydromethanopterin reductase